MGIKETVQEISDIWRNHYGFCRRLDLHFPQFMSLEDALTMAFQAGVESVATAHRIPRPCTFCSKPLSIDEAVAWATSGRPARVLSCLKCVPKAIAAI